MARIDVVGLDTLKAEEPLCNGRYTVKANRAQIITKEESGKQSLNLGMVVLAGPTQPDGSPAEDRQISVFLSVNHFETMNDGGRFARGLLASACRAASVNLDETGFDADEFIDKTFDVWTKITEYQGETQIKVNKYASSN